MKPRVYLSLLACLLTAGSTTDVRARAASSLDQSASVGAFLVAEATAGDLNGDGDAADTVVHVLNTETGEVVNLGLAVPVVCDRAFPPGFCSPVQPVVGDTIVAFLVSEHDQGAQDLNGDRDAIDDVVFVYDAARGEVRSTELGVAHGTTRSVSFITFPITPVVIDDVVVFLVGEGEQGGFDLNHDQDESDAVIHLVSPKKRHRAINVALAAPRIGFFHNPLLLASGDSRLISVLVGEPEQDADLNRDGDTDDVVTIEVRVQNGKARPAD